jgi:hypothetical protein
MFGQQPKARDEPYLPVMFCWPTAEMWVQRTVASMTMEYSCSDAMIWTMFYWGGSTPEAAIYLRPNNKGEQV